MTTEVTTYQPRASSMDRLFGALLDPFWPWLEMNRYSWMVRQLPNILTTVRLIIALPVVFLLGNALQSGGDQWAIIGWSLVFMVLFASDGLDGTIAYRLGIVSGYGRIVDPIADKVLVIGLMITLVVAGFHLLPSGYAISLAILVTLRVVIDIALVTVTLTELVRKRQPRAEKWGKRKLAADGVTAVFLTAGLGFAACFHPILGTRLVVLGCVMLLVASYLGLRSIDGHWQNLRATNKAT